MFTLKNLLLKYLNYPKYLILLNDISSTGFLGPYDSFYYLIAKKAQFKTAINRSFFKIFNKKTYTLPIYFIGLYFYASNTKSDEKFNLSKLGTDYIFNLLSVQMDCKGSYPNNYVFVKEPFWPSNIPDRTPLKCSYQRKEL